MRQKINIEHIILLMEKMKVSLKKFERIYYHDALTKRNKNIMDNTVYYACQSTNSDTERLLECWFTDAYLRRILENRLKSCQLHPLCYKEIVRRLDREACYCKFHLPCPDRSREIISLEVISQAEFEQHRSEAELSVNPDKHISDELIVY